VRFYKATKNSWDRSATHILDESKPPWLSRTRCGLFAQTSVSSPLEGFQMLDRRRARLRGQKGTFLVPTSVCKRCVYVSPDFVAALSLADLQGGQG
jgi:hypothetical protein